MKFQVIHITEDFSDNNYGVTSALKEIINATSDLYAQSVVTVKKSTDNVEFGQIRVFSAELNGLGKFWKYSKLFSRELRRINHKSMLTVFHIHGAWMAPQIIAAKYAIRNHIPIVISPHNMFSSWLWNRNIIHRIKKTIYWRIIAKPIFEKCNTMHALNPTEKCEISQLLPYCDVVIIPNGINLQLPPTSRSRVGNVKYFLFLGRLHPVKGIDILLQAYSTLPKENRPKLVVAGEAMTKDYYNSLVSLAESLKIVGDAEFVGKVRGAEKWTLIKNAFALCAPSHTEGVSMVALESMICSTPVLTSYEAGMDNINQGGGELFNLTISEISEKLKDVCNWSDHDRLSKGKDAYNFVRKHYFWERISSQYESMYTHIIHDSLNATKARSKH